MKFSIIIPVYNVDKYLRECLDSIKNQTFGDFEAICVNDGSTDNSLSILKEYKNCDSRFKIINQSNQGQGAARNVAIDVAKGEYILFIDPDDFIDLNSLQILNESINTTNAEVIHFDYETFVEEKNKNKIHHFKKSAKDKLGFKIKNKSFYSINNLRIKDFADLPINTTNKAYSRKFLQNNHIKFAQNKLAEDHIFSINIMLLAKKIFYIQNPLYRYRLRIGSSTHNTSSSNFCVFDNIELVKNMLIDKNLYNKYEYAFNNWVITLLAWHITNIPEDKLEIYKNEVAKIVSQKDYNHFLNKVYGDFTFIEKLFSIKNIKINGIPNKYICILGIKIPYKNFHYENLFSIKNQQKHIVYTFLGIKFKFSKLNKHFNIFAYNHFLHHNIPKKTICILEINDCHIETILGYSKYLLDLGYQVDILTRDITENIFKKLKINKLNVFECNNITFDKILENFDFTKYERLLYNSKIIYCGEGLDLHKYKTNIPTGKKQNIYIQHHIDRYFEYPNDMQIILANPAKDVFLENKVVNPHFFGDIEIFPKNPITRFITIGELNIKRRNCNLLINAIKQLVEQGINNFKIEVIGNCSLENLPKNIQPYFEIRGRLDFPQMFKRIKMADYILPLLDPNVEAHKRYMQDGTSGTFQLVYGFIKPCIIHKTFAEIYNFNNEDSIIYNDNTNIAKAMQYAINLQPKDYQKLQNKLKENVEKIKELSLENLKGILND